MNAIECYRRLAGITQRDLSEALGVSQAAISQWEKGTRVPDLTTVIKLSEILNVPTDNLIDLTKDFSNTYRENSSNNKLSYYRKKSGLTQDDVAEELGVTKSAVSLWERGKIIPSYENLNKLSKKYGIPKETLFETSDNGITNNSINDQKMKEINNLPPYSETPEFTETAFEVPLVATLRCGYNSSGQQLFDVLQKIELPMSYKYKYGADIVMIKAIGDSMIPTIRPRDLLICKPGEAWEDGQIVVANIDDNDTIKRIFHAKDKGIDLVPDNSKFRSLHFTPHDLQTYPPHVLGRIVRNMGQDL